MNLTFILDENIPPTIAEYIRSRRPTWDIRHIRDVGLRGADDKRIFQWAQEQRAIVLTFDEDFAIEQIENALDRLLNSSDDDQIPGSLIIIDDQRIRIRRAAQHG